MIYHKKATTPINPINLRKLSDATEHEILALYDNNQTFRELIKYWHYRNDVNYYCEIFRSCFLKCAEWYEANHGDIRFYIVEGSTKYYADFVDGLEKAQRNFCLLPDDMKPELELLYKVRSDWADCVDPEKENELYDTMKAMCDNFAEIIQEIVSEALNYWEDHPDQLRGEASEYVYCVAGDDAFFDCTTYHLFQISEYVDDEDC